ncbi:NAD(P)H:quinone oxidoreductase [Phenylobacterium sp. SCN 70-31]|uniref:NAD(P)H:quinone oxidoreductase n=1 Tax=Phenylobacterium sp. SCN 70-31 TaxID=1660129 RepID=UPI00086D3064|nr:NAD(P)H:quinone oxidoreductase [Phenylobacterium sp. SCN 70-31]ODT89727.1 MAG: NAD(P)H:quinone oxidoreductase, type IV [Phenylobacterium sp. SCN 70-31]
MSCRILIAFYSRNGSVEALARAIAGGAEAEGAEVRLRRARELVGSDIMARVPGWAETAERMNALYPEPTIEDAQWADGLILGAPTRFGAPASELRAWVDTLGPLWLSGALKDRAGAAFTSTSTPHGGTEATLLSVYPTLAHLGLVIVPNGYGDPTNLVAGTPYGASSVSHGAKKDPPTADDLKVAELQGRRVARIAAALAAARSAAG